jgi:hypothetical protein
MDADKMVEDMKKSFVPKYYVQDPEKEFLVTTGLLQNGMEVLIAAQESRIDLDLIVHTPGLFNEALERNRWCKISHLKHIGGSFQFTATYEDGTQRQRAGYVTRGWLVKLSSVDVLKQTHDAVHELVSKAMYEQDEASCDNDGCISVSRDVAASTTDSILEIFGMGVQK